MILDNDSAIKNRIELLYSKTYVDIMGDIEWNSNDEKIIDIGSNAAKNFRFSFYGLRNIGEFVAESVAQYFLSNDASEISNEVVRTLKGG